MKTEDVLKLLDKAEKENDKKLKIAKINEDEKEINIQTSFSLSYTLLF